MANRHGSEESNDDPPSQEGSPSISYTVDFPPATSLGGEVRGERNPLLDPTVQPEDPSPADLAKATRQGLIRYLEESKVTAEAVRQVAEFGLTGKQWIGMYGQEQDADAVITMISDFPAISNMRARMLRVDALEALQDMNAAAEVDPDHEARCR